MCTKIKILIKVLVNFNWKIKFKSKIQMIFQCFEINVT